MNPHNNPPEAPTERICHHVPPGVRIGGLYAGCLLLMGGALAGIGAMAWWLADIVVPFFIGLILAALLTPLSAHLETLRCPRPLAIALSWALVVGIIALLSVLVTRMVAGELPQLHEQLKKIGANLQLLFDREPFGLTQEKALAMLNKGVDWLQEHATAVGSHTLLAGKGLAQTLQGVLIALLVAVFAMADGRRMWRWVVGLAPQRARGHVEAAGQAGWKTLMDFARVQLMVAAMDAVGIGAGAVVLGVPLALPIAIIVFFFALVPVLGSIASGLIAILVALFLKGWITAVALGAIVIVVNQLESHVAQPILAGSAVRVHPLAIILGVAAGISVAGIVGAFFVVPLIATGNAMILAALRHNQASAAASAPA